MSTQRGRPFVVGNKFGRGRPKGSRNKSTAAAQELFNEYAAAIVKKCIAKALQGDSVCLRLCVERILAPLRDPLINVRFPRIQSTGDFTAVAQRIMTALSRSEITPAESTMIANTIEILIRAPRQGDPSGVPLEPKAVMPEFLVQALLAAQGLNDQGESAVAESEPTQPDENTPPQLNGSRPIESGGRPETK